MTRIHDRSFSEVDAVLETRSPSWRWEFLASTAAVVGVAVYSIVRDGNPLTVDLSGPPWKFEFRLHFSLLHLAAIAAVAFVGRMYFRLLSASSIATTDLRDTTFSNLAQAIRCRSESPQAGTAKGSSH
jgi:hypothetical protein